MNTAKINEMLEAANKAFVAKNRENLMMRLLTVAESRKAAEMTRGEQVALALWYKSNSDGRFTDDELKCMANTVLLGEAK